MKIMSWNVQWCRGIDGRVDPARIVAEAKRIADFDVLCLQEIADNFPEPRLGGNDDRDQFADIAALLPGYTAVAGHRGRPAGRRGLAAPLRQHDPVAPSRATGVSMAAALSRTIPARPACRESRSKR